MIYIEMSNNDIQISNNNMLIKEFRNNKIVKKIQVCLIWHKNEYTYDTKWVIMT